MIELSKISFSTISYITEDLNLVFETLKHCFPEKLRDVKFVTQKIQSQFGDKLTIIKTEFTGKDATNTIQYLASLLDPKDKTFIGSKLSQKIDMDSRLLHLRLDKFHPLSDKIKLSEGSDVIKVEIKYQVFTSKQNNLENIRNSLLDVGIVEV
ncbi:MAG: hypothetical protein GPJ54_21490 [Candidatus Heimdallarchaeota archaeon]|nr:hypothetical protein [Candidatus Heimdallarchaeota archaeon]